MKKTRFKTLLFIILTVIVTSKNAGAQESGCKVLMPAISGIYSGDCKKGLAQGHGTSQGNDRYEGQFSKGLPNGKGTYTWADGSVFIGKFERGLKNGEGVLVNDTSTLKGYWKNDEYIGEELVNPYELIRKDNLLSVNFRKTNRENNQVVVKLMMKGQINTLVTDFVMATNKGTQFKPGLFYGIQDASFPLDIKISYSTHNPASLSSFTVVFECTINEPGNWEVILNN